MEVVSKIHLTPRAPELLSWETVPRQALSYRDLIFAFFYPINCSTLGLGEKFYSEFCINILFKILFKIFHQEG